MTREKAVAREPVPDRAAHVRKWSALHQGHDPSQTPFVVLWLAFVHVLARPLVRRGVAPDTVTLAGTVVSILVPLAAVSTAVGVDRRLAALAMSVLVVISGIADNLDGAVAALADRSSRWGFVLDSVCDRIADVAYLIGLWALGAPGPLVAAAGALTGFQEYARARGIAAGLTEVGVITVAERPTRVLVAALFAFAAVVIPGRDDARIADWATAGAAVWTAVHVAGLAQVWRWLRRSLRPGRSAGP